jgi:hypothetical protein
MHCSTDIEGEEAAHQSAVFSLHHTSLGLRNGSLSCYPQALQERCKNSMTKGAYFSTHSHHVKKNHTQKHAFKAYFTIRSD